VVKKCEWGKFIVFELKCHFNKINANGVTECELKIATKIKYICTFVIKLL